MDLSRGGAGLTQRAVKPGLDPVRSLEEFSRGVGGEPGPAKGRGRVGGVRGPRNEGEAQMRHHLRHLGPPHYQGHQHQQ